jgi:hypothetical protein
MATCEVGMSAAFLNKEGIFVFFQRDGLCSTLMKEKMYMFIKKLISPFLMLLC